MLITKQTVVWINKKFASGHLINGDSLDFATKNEANGFLGNLPQIIRALLVDHCFEDGNKRTATYLLISFLEENRITVNQERLVGVVRDIARTNPKNMEKIRSMIKYAIK